MKLWKKGFAGILTAVMFLSSAMTAFAAEERTKITSVKLNIRADLEGSSDFSDMTLDVTSEGQNYYVEDYKLTSTSSSTYPTIEVILGADDGYYFNISSSGVKLTGDKASLTSKSTKNKSETLTLKIKLTDITANLDDVNYAELSSDGIAYWEGVTGAQKYELRLYRNNSTVGSLITTTDTEYDFRSLITRSGDYTFRVRAVGLKSKDKTDWTESGEQYFDTALGSGTTSSNGNPPPQASSGWMSNSNGWWYRNADGTYPANAWLFVDNNWFHFDGNGYMQTGWITDGGMRYYLNPASDGTKGRMVTGWNVINGKYYYFNPLSNGTKGALITNTVIDGQYRVGADGAWIQ
ncbi:hypothetical protein AALB16_01645 [Lachnospiraceae bacterium 62-35]